MGESTGQRWLRPCENDGAGTFVVRMIVFPHAKINLGLNVVRKRPDGYHDIQSVLVRIPLHDVLEAVLDPQLPQGEVIFTRSGLPVPGDKEQDLCMRAVKSIPVTRKLPGLRLHLHKVIPMGAGLGGGSSDGAYTLRLVNDLVGLGLGEAELHDLAMELGSDCPFFLRNGPQLVEGRGDDMTPITLDLGGLWILLVNPGIHVPTAEVYRNTSPTGTSEDLRAILTENKPPEWSGLLHNRMEPFVMAGHPAVTAIKDRSLEAGAIYAAMSGSGSTVMAIFDRPPPLLEWPASHRTWVFRW